MSNLTPPIFGKRLEMFRTLAGWSQQAAADVAGVARNTWGRWEAQADKPDSAEWQLALLRLAKVHPGHVHTILVSEAPMFPATTTHDVPATGTSTGQEA